MVQQLSQVRRDNDLRAGEFLENVPGEVGRECGEEQKMLAAWKKWRRPGRGLKTREGLGTQREEEGRC